MPDDPKLPFTFIFERSKPISYEAMFQLVHAWGKDLEEARSKAVRRESHHAKFGFDLVVILEGHQEPLAIGPHVQRRSAEELDAFLKDLDDHGL